MKKRSWVSLYLSINRYCWTTEPLLDLIGLPFNPTYGLRRCGAVRNRTYRGPCGCSIAHEFYTKIGGMTEKKQFCNDLNVIGLKHL